MPLFNCWCSMQAPKAAHAGQPRALAPLPVRHNARWVTRAEDGKVEKKGDDKGSKKVQKVKLWPAAASRSGVWQPSARSRASLSLFGAREGQSDCLMPPSRLAIARSAMSRWRHFATIQLQASQAALLLPKPAVALLQELRLRSSCTHSLTHSGTAWDRLSPQWTPPSSAAQTAAQLCGTRLFVLDSRWGSA